MGNTPICTIDEFGIHNPGLAACLAYFVAGYQGIYGSDVYLGSDSQDGEFMGLLGSAVDDGNSMAVQTYGAYSPATAQGAGLSSVVKINGLTRDVPSYSTAPVLIGGTVGTPIVNGIVADENNNQWALPALVTIPVSGEITVTATCLTLGAVAAPEGTVTTIVTQTRGWQTVSNTAGATPGAPVELDSQLRQRQSVSTMIPASGPLQATIGALWALPGVARLSWDENVTNAPDDNGVPGHSVAFTLDGGSPAAIAGILANMIPGTGTYGTSSYVVFNAQGVPATLNWYYVTEPPVAVNITITPLNGWSTNTEALIQESVSSWITSLGIGGLIELDRSYAAVYLSANIAAAVTQLNNDMAAAADATTIAVDLAAINAVQAASTTYKISSIEFNINGGAFAAADIQCAFNAAPLCPPEAVNVTVS